MPGSRPTDKREIADKPVHAEEISRYLGQELDVSPQEALERPCGSRPETLETLRERVRQMELRSDELKPGERVAVLTLYAE
jgi:hypothetical protein